MCSIIGVGERLHEILEQIDLGTLDSGERSLPFGLLVFILFVYVKTLSASCFHLIVTLHVYVFICIYRCLPYLF